MPKTLLTNNTELTKDRIFTFTDEDVVVGGSTLAVQSIVGFESLSTSSGQVVIIGKIGDEQTEIRRTSNTTGESPTPSYQWIYLRDTLQFNHPQSTPVTVVDWDRVEVQHATTVTGTKSTLFAYPFIITPDRMDTVIQDASQT